MQTSDLPDKVFMLGTRESATKFGTSGRKLPDGLFAACMWTSQRKLDAWLARRDEPRAHFGIETPVGFAGLFGLPAIRLLLVDPAPDENPFDDSFALDSFPADRRIDLHCVADVWSVMSAQV